jgi:hypothetical protein
MRYGVVGIGRNTVELSYHSFLDWTKKFGNFLLSRTVYLGWACYLFSFNPKSFQIFK